MQIPKCDSCGATEFVHLRDGWKPMLVLASDYFKQFGEPRIVADILTYHNWIARCKACGSQYHYTVQGAG